MREFAWEACGLAASGSREMLDGDLGFRRHAERLAELIGEAAMRFPEELKEERRKEQWRQIISMRNWLIRGYDGIDAEILWDVLDLRSRGLIVQQDVIIRVAGEP